ncbi:MAG: sugar phosphate isomerase/epimerase [Firmicutes bacterium]|nr:sugar phosphate isomerase/epimerase [Bacillota bacterium]
MILGCAEQLIPGDSIQSKFKLAAELGFESLDLIGLGLKEKAEIVRQAVDATGVRPGAIYSRLPNSILHPEPDLREKAILALKDRLDAAALVGAVGVILVPVFGDPLLPDLSPLCSAWQLEMEFLVALLKEVAPYAEEKGVYVILEPINKGETHFINTLAQGLGVCERVGSSSIGLVADVYHMNMEESIVDSVHMAGGRIVHVHMSSSDRRLPRPDDIDYHAFLQALKEVGYKGALGFECKAPDSIDELRESAAYVKRLIARS